jgi:hypothetical protein
MRRGGRSLEAVTDVIITIWLAVAAASPPLPWLAGAKRLIAGYLRVIRCVGQQGTDGLFCVAGPWLRRCTLVAAARQEESDVTPLR